MKGILPTYYGSDEEKKFEQLFTLFHAPLMVYTKGYIDDQSVCEDIVQEVFVSLWDNRDMLSSIMSVRSYLFTAVRNGCINHLKKKGHARRHRDFVMKSDLQNDSGGDAYLVTELYEMLENVLSRLPEAYRTVFEMNLVDRQNLSDVAEKLGVSLRTAKRYKAATMEILRKDLKDFLPSSSSTHLILLYIAISFATSIRKQTATTEYEIPPLQFTNSVIEPLSGSVQVGRIVEESRL